MRDIYLYRYLYDLRINVFVGDLEWYDPGEFP